MIESLRAENGSMLMEYVIIQLCVAFFVISLFFTCFYDGTNFVSGTIDVDGTEVGISGKAFVEYFQRLTSSISLPIP